MTKRKTFDVEYIDYLREMALNKGRREGAIQELTSLRKTINSALKDDRVCYENKLMIAGLYNYIIQRLKELRGGKE